MAQFIIIPSMSVQNYYGQKDFMKIEPVEIQNGDFILPASLLESDFEECLTESHLNTLKNLPVKNASEIEFKQS